MTDREKLIELAKGTPDVWMSETASEMIADHLIANGVTFATDNNVGGKWIPVTERLPDNDGEYLVRFDNKAITNTEYESKYGSFGYWLAIMWDEDADWYPYTNVTHWMPLPEPPKGE